MDSAFCYLSQGGLPAETLHVEPLIELSQRLRSACIRGGLTDVQQLLELKANVNSRQELSLQIAAASGSCNLVSLLLAYKADIHRRRDMVLRDACARGDVNLVALLLERKANINAWEGRPLFVARRGNHLLTVKLLLMQKGRSDFDYLGKTLHSQTTSFLWL